MNEVQQLQEKVASLTVAITEKHPRLPVLLKEILAALRQQPENTLLLSEVEISQIVNGIETHTNVFIAASVTKPAAVKTGTAKIKANAAAALGLD